MRKNGVPRWYTVVVVTLCVLIRQAEQQNVDFIVYTSTVSWNEARKVCESIGGNLAKVDSLETVEALRKLDEETPNIKELDPGNFWIGLGVTFENKRLWSFDCSSVNFTDHYDSYSSSNSKRCFRVDSNKLPDGVYDECKKTKSFMCQRITDVCHYDQVISINAISSGLDYDECRRSCSYDSSCLGVLHSENSSSCQVFYDSQGHNSTTNQQTFDIKISCLSLTMNATQLNIDSDALRYPQMNCSETNYGTVLIPSLLPNVSTSAILPSTSTVNTIPPCSPMVLTQHVTAYVEPTHIPVFTVTVTATPTHIPVSTVTVVATPTYIPVSTVSIFATPSCQLASTVINITEHVVYLIADQYSKNLTVDAKQTSSYIRSLISAPDHRNSATAVGLVGIGCVAVPIVLLICLDFRQILNDLRGIRRPDDKSKKKK